MTRPLKPLFLSLLMRFEEATLTPTKESFRSRSERALGLFREEYSQQHQTRLNRRLHLIGRSVRVALIPVVFYDWKIAIGLFVLGYLIQFLGHAIEGTSPSFFRNPKHLIIGSLNHVVRAVDKLKDQRSLKESVRILRQISILIDFIRWLIPEQGRSVRLYFSLLNVLIGSRQSVYRHFRELKPSDRGSRFREFLRALASVSDSGRASVPATLLARLLRTIYLTDVVPGKNNPDRRGGPNQGYINDPQFSYGDSLQSIIRPKM